MTARERAFGHETLPFECKFAGAAKEQRRKPHAKGTSRNRAAKVSRFRLVPTGCREARITPIMDGPDPSSFVNLTEAPGAPGGSPTWTSSAKDMVTTALGNGRVWVTLGHGILNEIYWPA